MEELSLSINPFALLTGEVQPPQQIKRQRGRPRKHNLPTPVSGKREHKLGDDEISCKSLNSDQHRSMIEFFKSQIKTHTLQQSISNSASKFEITYSKAYTELIDYF